MAATKTTPPEALPETVARYCAAQVAPGARIGVALSGGMDSVVLLHLLAGMRDRNPLSAVHVHHGLSPHASDWACFCARLCERLDIPLHIQEVHVDRHDRHGLEAAARSLRYECFRRTPVDYLALAHHRDDQAETVLLQLLRGAGVQGLAAMPPLRRLEDGPMLLRPLLGIERARLRAWAESRGLHWVEDESNADTRYTRNHLRQHVLPAIEALAPAWRTTLARTASHMADATELLEDLANQDAATAIHERRLDCGALARLSAARARNLLRHFLAGHELDMPDSALLHEMHRQLVQASHDTRLRIQLGTLVLHASHGSAWLVREQQMPPPGICWRWHGEPELELPELGGRLEFEMVTGAGMRLPNADEMIIRARIGGENLQPYCRRPRRAVKKWLQESGIPSWQRAHLPFVWCSDQLAHVVGIGTDCAWQARPGEPGLLLHWRPGAD